MKISIALCTYNGSSFLQAQLESFQSQTRKPDEVVICDDGSSDSTLDILYNFQGKAPFPMRIHRNGKNLGSTKNFEKAIGLCQGNIIALSDQDDVWLPNKLEQIEKIFLGRPRLQMAFSDAEVVDAELRPLGYSLWESVGFNRRLQGPFTRGNDFLTLARGNVVTGATMAFRTEHRDLILPIPNLWIHDAWIALLLAGVGQTAFLEDRLILYRQHANNQIGAPRRDRDFAQEVEGAKNWGQSEIYSKAKVVAAARMRLSREPSLRPESLKQLDGIIHHLLARRSIHKSGAKGFSLAARELFSGHYHRYSKGFKSFLAETWREIP